MIFTLKSFPAIRGASSLIKDSRHAVDNISKTHKVLALSLYGIYTKSSRYYFAITATTSITSLTLL